MKPWLGALVLVAASLLMAGCAAPIIRSDVTAFHEWPATLADQTYVFERSKDQDNNLEYRNYENLVRAELNRLGFTEASSSRPATLIVSLAYGISARDVRISEPVIMNPYWYGPSWRGYYGPFYDPFWYGPPIVERRESNYRLFTRQLKVTLMQALDRKRLYDTTVVSEGTNGSLAAVMPYMVKSAFADFPGKNGVPRQVELKMEQ